MTYDNIQIGTLYCTTTLPDDILEQIPSFYNIQYIEKNESDKGNTIFARRINIGCINNPYALVCYTFDENEKRFRNFKRFAKCLGKILDFDFNGRHFSSRPIGICGFDDNENDDDETNDDECDSEIRILGDNSEEYEVDAKIESQRTLLLQKIEELILEYVKKYKTLPAIKDLKAIVGEKTLLGIPTDPIEKHEKEFFSIPISQLSVNSKLQIVLSAYNSEIKLSPQLKTLYIFFIKHTNGIFLKDIKKHRNEIEEIYRIVSPNKNEGVITRFMKSICDDPQRKRLRESIAKTNSKIREQIMNPDITDEYCILGKREEKYRICLAEEKRSIPECFGDVDKLKSSEFPQTNDKGKKGGMKIIVER